MFINADRTVISIFVSMVLIANAAAEPTSDSLQTQDLRSRISRLLPMEQDEVLWLGRCIYSESNRAYEQELVAWVVRNRVETRYRGNNYREVVLEAKQFSAFNQPSTRRSHILSLNHKSISTSWLQTLGIALEVYEAPDDARPFSITTRHFYSPISMKGTTEPEWAENATPLSSEILDVDPNRFLFYDDVDGTYTPADEILMSSTSSPANQVGDDTDKRSRFLDFKPSGKIRRPVRPSISRPRVY